MSSRKITTKRVCQKPTLLRRLMAVTSTSKHRAATTADEELQRNQSAKIARALSIIVLVHILGIVLAFIHYNFLEKRKPAITTSGSKSLQSANLSAPVVAKKTSSRVAPGEASYAVRAGDNYAKIAKELGVNEADLMAVNEMNDIMPGKLLKVPAKRPAATQAPQALTTAIEPDEGLVEIERSAVKPAIAGRETLVKVKAPAKPMSAVATAAQASSETPKTYVVQNGDSIWRISSKFKVKQEALMKLNGLDKDGKIKAGMILQVPR